MKLLKPAFYVASALVITACGGGSGDSDTTSKEANNDAPQASNVSIRYNTEKTLYTGSTLQGMYSYSDNEEDAEGASQFRWLVDGEVKGTEQDYTIAKADADKTIVFEVVPVAATGSQTGTAVQSTEVTATLRQFVPFTAYISENERTTLITDGTEAGTFSVKDFNTAVAKEHIYYSIQFGDKWLMNLDTSFYGKTLAVTDGTIEGSQLVDGENLSQLNPYNFVVFKDKVFFTGTDSEGDSELWVTDGTAEGTQLFLNISLGYLSGTTPNKGLPGNFTPIGDKMVFTAYTTRTGTEPWVTDGTVEGTHIIRDLSGDFYGSNTSYYFSFNGKAYFTYNSFLYTSDGTSEGTHALMNSGPTNVSAHTLFKDKLVLVATDDGYNAGAGLWVSDGTAEGTTYLDSKTGGDRIYYIVATDDHVYYSTTSALYSYNETEGVKLINGTHYSITELMVLNNQVFFNATDGEGYGLHTVENNEIKLVKKPNNDSVNAQLVNIFTLNDEIFFNADDGIHGNELWHSDGTETGTALLKDILGGSEPSHPSTCHLLSTICRR